MQAGATAAPAEPAAVDSVGVPDASNHYLPGFGDSYGQAFFEREGLRFRIGPVHFRMNLTLGEEYNDNILGTNTDTEADLITSISPVFEIGMGDFTERDEDFLHAEYQPGFDYYATHSTENNISQSLTVEGQATFSRFSSTLSASYISSNEPNAVQTGRQNYQQGVVLSQNSYMLTPKLFVRAVLSANLQDYENDDRYQTYSFSPLLGYVLTEKTTLTFGPLAGIAYIGNAQSSNAGTQTFQGLNLGMTYDTLRKLKFEGNFGFQSRQYNGDNTTGASNFTTPVFAFAINYQATEKTNVTLQLNRDVQITDLLQGQTYTDTQFNCAIAHAFSPHFSAVLNLNYQYIVYQGATYDGRTDQYASFIPALNYTFWREQCKVTIYYRGQQRSSTEQSADYTVNAYGIQFTYNF